MIVALSQRAWIEITIDSKRYWAFWSPSHRGRGLKSAWSLSTHSQWVALSQRAWIEIFLNFSVVKRIEVALSQRAWIEMICHQQVRLLSTSPSHRGRGLKLTRVLILKVFLAMSPSHRGRGLKCFGGGRGRR